MWKILIVEWILLLKIQTNCKNWVWKEKSVDPQCVHIAEFLKKIILKSVHIFLYLKFDIVHNSNLVIIKSKF